MSKFVGRRIILVAIFFFLFVSFLAYRLFWLQYLNYSVYAKKSKGQHRVEITLPSVRGEILDRRREPLALSVPSKSVYADCLSLLDPDEAAKKISRILKIDFQKLQKILSQKKRFIWVKRKISEEEYNQVKALNVPGIYFLEEPKRYYPKGKLLSHVLGFVGVDNQGLEGLERSLDSFLKGSEGKRVTGRDRRGREVITLRDESIDPVDGYHVILTIDEVIQYIAEQELETVYDHYQPKAAMIVVLNPKTGEILALANRPTFNPNQVNLSVSAQRRNRVVTDFFEPGSTFKVITAAAALDQKTVELDEIIYCEDGAFWYGGHVLHDTHPHRELSFKQVIAKSSNIGTAKVAIRMGGPSLYTYIRRFGFGSVTGSELLGETSGLVYPPKKWSKYSIVAIPMGQEVAVSALQITCAIGAIANNGVLMRPTLIKRIVDSRGQIIREFGGQMVRKVVEPETARQLTETLQEVVSHQGTAYRASIPGYLVAGKTGTAQKAVPGQGYSKDKYVASFVGYVPAEDPKLCIGIFVDEPQGNYYGGVVAAPVFAKVGKAILKYLDIPPVMNVQAKEAGQPQT